MLKLTPQPQFSTPVAIDPALVQNDIYARNLCWPMCVQMACPTGEQVSKKKIVRLYFTFERQAIVR